VSSGSLPAGITLSSGGELSGTPGIPGTSSFTVQTSEANGVTAVQTLSLVVNAEPTITRNNLPDLKVNHNYAQTVTASGGTAPLVWSISASSLPIGLSLNSSNGLISGTATIAATYNFIVTVSDTDHVSATKALSIKVKP
jgi:hypothetical protein